MWLERLSVMVLERQFVSALEFVVLVLMLEFVRNLGVFWTLEFVMEPVMASPPPRYIGQFVSSLVSVALQVVWWGLYLLYHRIY